MIILEDQNSETYFIDVLDFIEQELRLVLANAQFNLAHGLLEKIKQLTCDPSGQFSWRNKLIQDFFFKISLDEILEVLETGLLKLKLNDSNQILCFKRVMLMLEAEARGHSLLFYTPKDMTLAGSRVMAKVAIILQIIELFTCMDFLLSYSS